MNIVFRTDSSVQIGTGHIMRCLTLAQELKRNGANILFISRNLPGNQCGFINSQKFRVSMLPYEGVGTTITTPCKHSLWLGVDWEVDASETLELLKNEVKIDWLVVDHYSLDYKWETKFKSCVKKIMVIDDLADRKHECNLLLDQNLFQDMDIRYKQLVPNQCINLLGPQYALIRQEFVEVRKNLRLRDGQIKRILIFFGGSDPTNETRKALEAVSLLNDSIAIDVVVGGANPNKDQIKHICSGMKNVSFYCQVNNMAELMAHADLAIGAGGTATWERCSMGLPTIIISLADNQIPISESADYHGFGVYLGNSNDVTADNIYEAIISLMSKPEEVLTISNKAKSRVDTRGTIRVVNNILY